MCAVGSLSSCAAFRSALSVSSQASVMGSDMNLHMEREAIAILWESPNRWRNNNQPAYQQRLLSRALGYNHWGMVPLRFG